VASSARPYANLHHTRTHHSVFYRLDAVPAARPTASNLRRYQCAKIYWNIINSL